MRLIDLCYYSPRIESADEQGFNAAFVATETLLGEQCLDRWVGAIEINSYPDAGVSGRDVPRHAIKLDRLKETVDVAVESIRDQLPPSPHHEWVEEAEWTMWRLEPEPADDFPDQADLFVGKSPNPSMWIAAHSGRPFYSERFTRCGETFCYLKVDGAEGIDDSTFADKGDIEDALDEALIPRGLGCQVGGGMGLRYAYIDLALTDVPYSDYRDPRTPPGGRIAQAILDSLLRLRSGERMGRHIRRDAEAAERAKGVKKASGN